MGFLSSLSLSRKRKRKRKERYQPGARSLISYVLSLSCSLRQERKDNIRDGHHSSILWGRLFPFLFLIYCRPQRLLWFLMSILTLGPDRIFIGVWGPKVNGHKVTVRNALGRYLSLLFAELIG